MGSFKSNGLGEEFPKPSEPIGCGPRGAAGCCAGAEGTFQVAEDRHLRGGLRVPEKHDDEHGKRAATGNRSV